MFIFSNLAISLDGKIALQDRSHFPLGTDVDRKQMQVLRKRCDAIVMGASTIRSFKKPCLVRDAKWKTQPANVLISSKLAKLSPQWPFFTDKRIRRILFVKSTPPAQRLKVFAHTSEIILLKKNVPTAIQIIRELKKRGFKNILVEGGGEVMWNFVSQNLIQEYHITVTPKILGGDKNPTLVDGPGFQANEILNLRFKNCRRVKNELFLVYQRVY